MKIWRGSTVTVAATVLAATVLAATGATAQAQQPAPAAPAPAAPAAPAAAPAVQALPVPMVIVIDYADVIRESTAGKGILAERDKYVQQFQKEFSAEEQELRNTEKDLVNQRAKLSAEKFNEKYRSFQQKVQDVQKKAQDRRKAIDEAFNKAMNTLQRELVQIVDKIAQEQKANLVLLKGQVFLHDPRMEITATAINWLNEAVPSIEFPKPVAEAPAADKKAADKKDKK